MQKRVFFALSQPWSAADNQDGRFFGKRFRGRVGELETAHTVRDAHSPEPANARIGVGRKTRPLLITRVDQRKLTSDKLIVKAEDIIPWNSKNMLYAQIAKALDEIFTNQFFSHAGFTAFLE